MHNGNDPDRRLLLGGGDMDEEQLMKRLVEFRDAREWKQFHTSENLAKAVAVEAGELLELFQWGDAASPEDVGDEIADIMIYCFLLAHELQQSPLELMRAKLDRNERRFPVDKVKGTSGKTTRVDR